MLHFITAEKIHNGKQFLSDQQVLVIDDEGTLVDIIRKEQVEETHVKIYQGILCPGFINAHCHLELSHLKDQIPEQTGIVDFAGNVVSTRQKFSPEQIEEAARKADQLMWKNGIVAVGDICNTNHTIDIKSKSNMFYHSFIELIGLNPEKSEPIFSSGKQLLAEFKEKKLSASLAPHAPYSVSTELMNLIAGEKRICSIHNQESEEENKFFKNKSGDFLKLYHRLNLSIDYFQPTGKTSLQSYLPNINWKQNLLLVHNTFTSEEDIELAENINHHLFWCLCPNANLYIENKLPQLTLFKNKNLKMCIGTDSLASNKTLDILSEIKTLSKHFSEIELEEILTWATYNGAEFLGIHNQYGTFEKNKKPGINWINLHQDKAEISRLF